MQFRLLPLLIFFCSIGIITKIVDMSGGMQNFLRHFDLAGKEKIFSHNIYAMTEEKPTAPAADSKPASPTDSKTAGGENAPKAASDNAAIFSQSKDGQFCLTQHFSEAELNLLQNLADRNKELEAWAKQLRQKDEIINATEGTISNKLQQLESLKAEVKSLIAEYTAQENSKIDNLVKIYSTMKPTDASKIFDQLDMKVLLQLFSKMKEGQAAPILANMDPVKAREVTIDIANGRDLGAPENLICP